MTKNYLIRKLYGSFRGLAAVLAAAMFTMSCASVPKPGDTPDGSLNGTWTESRATGLTGIRNLPQGARKLTINGGTMDFALTQETGGFTSLARGKAPSSGNFTVKGDKVIANIGAKGPGEKPNVLFLLKKDKKSGRDYLQVKVVKEGGLLGFLGGSTTSLEKGEVFLKDN